MGTGFASDDYGWLRHAVRGELTFEYWIKFAGHTNSLPLEIALYQLKFFLFGFNAIGYHLFALAGHVVNVMLIYALGRRLGLTVRVASLAAGIAAVLAAGTQAIYWMSGDPHVFAAMLTMAALVLYIDHREKRGLWRFVGAVVLAVMAPLVKAEGVAVIAGVVGYELLARRQLAFTWKLVPFLMAPVPFVVWEWTTTDQLSTKRDFGLNMVTSGLDYLRQLVLPLNPVTFIDSPGGLAHRVLNLGIGAAIYVEAGVLLALLALGLWRRQSWIFLVVGLAATTPALVVTLGTQPRYIYCAGLMASPIIALGANSLFKWGWSHYAHQRMLTVTTIALAAVLSMQAWLTAIESGALRAAHSESLAFRSAVLKDHSSVPDRHPICIEDSPLDAGTATAVFADPRLGANVGIPTVSECDSRNLNAPGSWTYRRRPDGSYVQIG